MRVRGNTGFHPTLQMQFAYVLLGLNMAKFSITSNKNVFSLFTP